MSCIISGPSSAGFCADAQSAVAPVKASSQTSSAFLGLDFNSHTPLAEQFYNGLRSAAVALMGGFSAYVEKSPENFSATIQQGRH